MAYRSIVLVVEDQPDIAELIRMEFTIAGWDVHLCGTADDALPMALRVHPDVAIVDVMLPGFMNGFDLCRKIKSHDSLAATAVIVLSALTGEASQTAGKIAGCDAYITKPFLPSELQQLSASLA